MEENNIIVNEEACVFYTKDTAILFKEKKSAASKVKTPSSPIVTPNASNSTGIIAKWGDDNLFPQTVIQEARKSTIIPSTLDWKARALYSGGITYGTVSYKDDGTEVFTPAKMPAIEDFFRKSNVYRYGMEAAVDFYWFFNNFPELVLSNDRSQIVAITSQAAENCRWSLQNKSTGLIEWCYINANWGENETETSPSTIKVPVIDPYYDPVTALRERKDGFKYIYPISYPTPGSNYYQLAHWNSIRESGWLDVASEIVKFKKYLMQNQMSIKYIIDIPEYWWQWKYPDWQKYGFEKKNEIRKTEITEINKFLKGGERAGTSVITTSKFDVHLKLKYPGWEIKPIEDRVKDGAYIEDSQEASSHMLYALGVDATLIGTAPGKGLGAGSGSDKRVAFNIYISLCKIHQDIILEPLRFIRDYNGWDSSIEFRFRNSLITTLDKGKETQQQTS